MVNITKKYIKSPLNYVGGKHKLLPQIEPMFPRDIDVFYDLFTGGGNVGVNVEANRVVFNDTEKVVIDLIANLAKLGTEQSLETLKVTINEYQLSKTNEEGYYQLREDYNAGDKSWNVFYAMLTHAFNYQIRFNKSGEYNMPFGKNRSWFNPRLEKNFIRFVDKLNNMFMPVFSDKDFRDFEYIKYNKDDFVYCDPPYLITTASYNESGGWTKDDERDLLSFLDGLNSKGVRFALSNVLESKGNSNNILKEWSNKYKVYYLDKSYSNSNYQRKNNKQKDVEVLITNY